MNQEFETKLSESVDDEKRDKALRREALIEGAVALVILLIMEQVLLPFSNVTRQQIEMGTVLVFYGAWNLLYEFIVSRKKRR